MGVWSERVGGPCGARRRYVATASVIALAVGFSLTPAPSKAQQGVSGKSSRSAIAFDIPSQSLNSAILTYADRAGVQVFYDVQRVSGLRSSAVTGSYSREQALAQLLAGTGITYRFSGNTVSLTNPASADAAGGVTGDGSTALQAIVIQGANANSTMTLPEEYAGGQVATGAQVGMLGNRSVMDTPFSQTSYTNKKIEDQQARTLQEVLSNDPSVVTNTQGGGYNLEATTIRGFSDQANSGSGSLNGLAGMSPLNSPDMDYIERVEVLRGPSALLNGMSAQGVGGIGGTVALRTKQAGDEPLTQLTTRYMSRSQLGAHLDTGRRFGVENQFGVRFNGAFRKGGGPLDTQEIEIGSGALNLDYRGERVRISVDIAHQSNETSPLNHQFLNLGTVGVVPDAPDAGTSLLPEWSRHRIKSTMAMVRGEVDITDNVTAYAAIGKQRSNLFNYGSINPTLIDTSGQYRYSYVSSLDQVRDVLSMQGGLRAEVNTGPVVHKLGLNLSQTRFEIKSGNSISLDSCTMNIYNPVFCPAPTSVYAETPVIRTVDRTMSSIAIADTMSFLDERIQFTAGIRYQQVEATAWSGTTGAQTTDYESAAWTPVFALVAKPWENVSVYGNYIQALQPGSIVGSTYANSGEVLPPYLGEQYEAGVKVDWGAVTTTLALFQITQASTISIADPNGGLPTLAANGQQHNRGIELNAYGEVMDGIRLLGGVTLLDARLAETQNGAYDGNRAAGAPRFRAVFGAEWDTPFMEGLTLTGRVNYTGDQVASNTNESLKIPSYSTLDLGARYTFSSPWNKEPVTIRFNVDNVFDKDYWSTANNGILYFGTPRTFRLSAAFRF